MQRGDICYTTTAQQTDSTIQTRVLYRQGRLHTGVGKPLTRPKLLLRGLTWKAAFAADEAAHMVPGHVQQATCMQTQNSTGNMFARSFPRQRVAA